MWLCTKSKLTVQPGTDGIQCSALFTLLLLGAMVVFLSGISLLKRLHREGRHVDN